MDATSALQEDPFTRNLSGRRLGRYEVLAKLASGGMAGIYIARAQGVAGFERLFAVKVLHPHLAHEEEFISMFLDEARLAARIHHPNVVATLDVSDTHGAGYFLVMEYVEGDHLGALLQRAFQAGERLPVPVTLRIVSDGLSGLGAAHYLTDEAGNLLNLVHRDVSPHNIMVGTDGISRLTDFGVAKAEVRLSTTREGQFKGKLAYMAPEQASAGRTDQRSDLFSMGIILWECLTGRRLFRADNHAATLNKICIEPIPLPSEVDPGLAAFDPVLTKALERDPDRRFQTAEEFAEALEEVAGVAGGLATLRTVGKCIAHYAHEKLQNDRELIRTAIAEVATADADDTGGHTYTPTPPQDAPLSGSMPAPAASMPAPPATAAETVAEVPSSSLSTAAAPDMRTGGTGRRWAAAAVLVISGIGVAWAIFGTDPEEPVAAPLEAAETPAAAEEPATDRAAAGADTANEENAKQEGAAEARASADPGKVTDSSEHGAGRNRNGKGSDGERSQAERRRPAKDATSEGAAPEARHEREPRTASSSRTAGSTAPREPQPGGTRRSQGQSEPAAAKPQEADPESDPFDAIIDNPYR